MIFPKVNRLAEMKSVLRRRDDPCVTEWLWNRSDTAHILSHWALQNRFPDPDSPSGILSEHFHTAVRRRRTALPPDRCAGSSIGEQPFFRISFHILPGPVRLRHESVILIVFHILQIFRLPGVAEQKFHQAHHVEHRAVLLILIAQTFFEAYLRCPHFALCLSSSDIVSTVGDSTFPVCPDDHNPPFPAEHFVGSRTAKHLWWQVDASIPQHLRLDPSPRVTPRLDIVRKEQIFI